jgi:hypothetical protein
MSGYSNTPLSKKLGYKNNFVTIIRNEPDYYWSLMPELQDLLIAVNGKSDIDLAHLFFADKQEMMNAIIEIKPLIKQNGIIWISWPKKSSKINTDITEDVIRNFALDNGLVDVKVCAVDDIWSGLKLVIRLKDRLKKQ